MSNLDDLFMQFKDTIDSMQQVFKRAETQIDKLVDDITKVVSEEKKNMQRLKHIKKAFFKLIQSIINQSPKKKRKKSPLFQNILAWQLLAML